MIALPLGRRAVPTATWNELGTATVAEHGRTTEMATTATTRVQRHPPLSSWHPDPRRPPAGAVAYAIAKCDTLHEPESKDRELDGASLHAARLAVGERRNVELDLDKGRLRDPRQADAGTRPAEGESAARRGSPETGLRRPPRRDGRYSERQSRLDRPTKQVHIVKPVKRPRFATRAGLRTPKSLRRPSGDRVGGAITLGSQCRSYTNSLPRRLTRPWAGRED